MQTKIAAKLRAKSLAEPCLLLSVDGYLFRSISCQIPKFTTICIHSQSSLGEIAELFPLAIYETFRDVMLTKASLNSAQVVIWPTGRIASKFSHQWLAGPSRWQAA